MRQVVAVAATSVRLGLRPRLWPRTVRNALARQIVLQGVDAVPLLIRVAILTGISLVLQAQLFLSQVGQSELIGPLIGVALVREGTPVLVNLLVIARSGGALATELANMRLTGQIRVLNAQGLDPFVCVVMPRVLATALSVCCLSVFFLVITLSTGFVTGAVLDVHRLGPAHFADAVYRSISVTDWTNLFLKSLLPGLLTGAICCTEGFGGARNLADVPRSGARAVYRALGALFFVSVVFSALTYI